MVMARAGVRPVLVIEDESAFRSLLNSVLGDEYEVIETASADDGMRSFMTRQPDAVLLDIRMPGRDGLQTLRSIRERDPYTTVILMTGFPEVETLRDALKLGATYFLEKPVSPEEIRHTVRRGVERTLAARRREQSAEEMNGLIVDLNRQLSEARKRERHNVLTEHLARYTGRLCQTAAEAGREGYAATAELRSKNAAILLELTALAGREQRSAVRTVVSFSSALQEVLDAWGVWSKSAGIPVQSVIRIEQDALVQADRAVLVQVLSGLMGHALLRADKSGRGIRLAVLQSNDFFDMRIEYRDRDIDGVEVDEGCDLYQPGLELCGRMLQELGGMQQVNHAPGKTSIIALRLPMVVSD